VPTEKEKMLQGAPYRVFDPELKLERRKARKLLSRFNNTKDRQSKKRQKILKKLVGRMGENVSITPPFYCDYGYNISLGDQVYFNTGCIIMDVMPVTIGSNFLCGPRVQLLTASHPMDAVERSSGKAIGKPITIGDQVWVGAGSIICPGVTIGSRTVIGAGSVVTKNIPSDCVAAGNPCKVIRMSEQ
jgi:maltose O-acetyltransferase